MDTLRPPLTIQTRHHLGPDRATVFAELLADSLRVLGPDHCCEPCHVLTVFAR